MAANATGGRTTAAIGRSGWLAVLLAMTLAGCVALPEVAKPSKRDGTTELRSFSIDDLLKLEDTGQARVDPTGRQFVFERRRPYEDGPWFGHHYLLPQSASVLFTADVGGPGPARPLFPQRRDAGYWLGAFSPDGSRLGVFRLDTDGVHVGIFEEVSGQFSALPFTPDILVTGPGQVWLDNETLIQPAMASGRQPLANLAPVDSLRPLAQRWEQSWAGQAPTTSALGSGRYFKDRGTTGGRLVSVNVTTNDVTQLAEGDFVSLSPSPKRRAVAALRQTVELLPKPNTLIGLPFQHRRHELIVFDLSRADPEHHTVCSDCDVLTESLIWSASGDRLMFFARRPHQTWREGQLYTYSLDSKVVVDITPMDVEPGLGEYGVAGHFNIRAAWMGETPVVFAQPADGGNSGNVRSDWFALVSGDAIVNLTTSYDAAPPRLLAASSDAVYIVSEGNVWRIDSRGERRNLTSSIDSPVRIVRAPTEDHVPDGANSLTTSPRAVLETTGAATSRWVILDLNSGDVDWIDKPSSTTQALSVSTTQAAVLGRDDKMAGRILVSLANSQSKPVAEINRHLNNVQRPQAVEVETPGKDGQVLTSWLLLPPDAKPGEQYPLVVRLYPGLVYGPDGPRADLASLVMSPHNPEPVVAQGYAVLLPSIPLQPAPSDPVAGLAGAVLAIVDKVIELGYADPDRLALQGHSYGGYGALAVATQTDRFNAIVASASFSNLASLYGTMALSQRVDFFPVSLWWSVGWAERGQGRIGAAPWQDPNRFTLNSPLFDADKINTPILLIHGDLDSIPISQSEEMYTALFRQGKDALYLRYWGERHVFASPANIRDMWRHIFDWYEEHLVPGPGS